MEPVALRCPSCGGVVSKRNEVNVVQYDGIDYHPCTDRCRKEFEEWVKKQPKGGS